MSKYFCIVLLLIFAVFSACSDFDGDYTTNPVHRLTMETDTVNFDTVFTTLGSSTKRFRVFNHNNKNITIAEARLQKGTESPFHINIDGHALSTSLSHIDIAAKDSIFLFFQVTPPENHVDTLVTLCDTLIFRLQSGTEQHIILTAQTQDVNFIHGAVIDSDIMWNDPRPYVIYDSLVVKPDATLTLAAGTTLCFHEKAMLENYGTLVAEGTASQPVTFRGDRTDRIFSYLPYDQMTSQWEGLHFYPTSHSNVLNHVDLHSAEYGIIIDTLNINVVTDEPQLTLLNSTIHNINQDALNATYASLYVANSQISNAGGNCVTLIGGNSTFVHTTIAQFDIWNTWRHGKALYFSNFIEKNDTAYIYPLHQALFVNCLITGNTTDEIVGQNMEDRDDIDFNPQFQNCLVNIDLGDANDESQAAARSLFINCVNETELFHQINPKPSQAELDEVVWGEKNFILYTSDFHLDSLSQARGIGQPAAAQLFPTDHDGVERPLTKPDAGCYQSTYSEP